MVVVELLKMVSLEDPHLFIRVVLSCSWLQVVEEGVVMEVRVVVVEALELGERLLSLAVQIIHQAFMVTREAVTPM